MFSLSIPCVVSTLACALLFVAPLVADDLVSEQKGSTLRLTSTGAVNVTCDVEGLEPGELRVRPEAETTVDGGIKPTVFQGVLRLELRAEGQGSVVALDFLELPKGLVVETGAASDELVVRGGSYGKLVALDLGDGDNALTFQSGVQVLGKLRVDAGAGADQVSFLQTAFVKQRARLELSDGGNDLFVTGGASFGASLHVHTGTAGDGVIFDQGASVAKRARLWLGHGNNNLFVRNGSSLGKLRVASGSGGSVMQFESGSSADSARFDLEGGANFVGLLTAASVGKLDVRGGAGSEFLVLDDGAQVGKLLRARLETGLNSLSISSGASCEGAVVYTGDGNANTLTLGARSVIAGKFTAKFGDGLNTFTAAGAELQSSLSLTGGDGPDSVDFDAASVAKKVKLRLGAGTNDSSAVDASDFGASVRITGGPGDDSVDWSGATVAGKFKFVGKGGEDTVVEPL